MSYFNFNHPLPLLLQQSGFVADREKSIKSKETSLVQRNSAQVEKLIDESLKEPSGIENDLNNDSGGKGYYTTFLLDIKTQYEQDEQEQDDLSSPQNIEKQYKNYFTNYLKILISTYDISEKLAISFLNTTVPRGIFLNNLI